MPVADLRDDAERRLLRRVDRRLLPFALACFVAAQIDRINVGFAKLTMLGDLGMSQTAYGIGAGIFFLAYFLFEVPSNLMLDRVGCRTWIARIMVSWALLSAATALVQTAAGFYVLRFLLGMAEAGFFPALILHLSRWYPPPRRATAIATMMLGLPVTGVIGGPLSGAILAGLDGAAGIAGWRWLFLIEALPAFTLGLLALRWLDDDIAAAGWLSEAERALLLRLNPVAPVAHAVKRVSHVLRDPLVWRLGLIYFSIGAVNYGLAFWLPTLLSAASGRGPLAVGLYSAVPSLLAVVTTIGIARWSDHSRRRKLPFVLCAATAALALTASVSVHWSFGPQLAIYALATAGGSALPPIFWAVATRALGAARLTVGTAAINCLANLAGFFGPYLIGVAADRFGGAATGLAGFALLLAATTLLLVLGWADDRAAPPAPG